MKWCRCCDSRTLQVLPWAARLSVVCNWGVGKWDSIFILQSSREVAVDLPIASRRMAKTFLEFVDCCLVTWFSLLFIRLCSFWIVYLFATRLFFFQFKDSSSTDGGKMRRKLPIRMLVGKSKLQSNRDNHLSMRHNWLKGIFGYLIVTNRPWHARRLSRPFKCVSTRCQNDNSLSFFSFLPSPLLSSSASVFWDPLLCWT